MGSGAANRMTSVASGCAVAFTSVGVVCGAQDHTLTTAQIPAHTHPGSTSPQTAIMSDISNTSVAPAANAATDNFGNAGAVSTVFRSSQFAQQFVPSMSLSIASQGETGAHPNVQPTMAMKKIVRIF
jgi:microcystin-dependent protein